MTIADATREYQAALEYRRTARDRYTTDEELAECEQVVEQAARRLYEAWVLDV